MPVSPSQRFSNAHWKKLAKSRLLFLFAMPCVHACVRRNWPNPGCCFYLLCRACMRACVRVLCACMRVRVRACVGGTELREDLLVCTRTRRTCCARRPAAAGLHRQPLTKADHVRHFPSRSSKVTNLSIFLPQLASHPRCLCPITSSNRSSTPWLFLVLHH